LRNEIKLKKYKLLDEGQEVIFSSKLLLPARTPISNKKGDIGKDNEIPQKAANLT